MQKLVAKELDEILDRVYGAEANIRLVAETANLTENQNANLEEALEILAKVRQLLAAAVGR